MAEHDYRSPAQEQANKDFGFGSTMDQANKLRDFLQQQNLSQVQQSQFMQKLQSESDRQKAGFQNDTNQALLGEQIHGREAEAAGQAEQQKLQNEAQGAKDLYAQTNKGAGPFGQKTGVTYGSVKVDTAQPGITQIMGKSGEEASKAQKHVDGQLKDGKDAVNAVKLSLDSLDLGTAEGDTAALLNEGKAMGGARAAVAFSNKLDPGHTVPGFATTIANVLNGQGTSQLTPDQRNNLREMAFARANSIYSTYQKTKPGLQQQIASASPISNQMGTLQQTQESAFAPYDSMFNEINSRHKQYMDQKVATSQPQQTAQNPQQPYSQKQGVLSQVGHSLSNGLAGLFGMSETKSKPASPSEGANPPMAQQNTPSPQTMRVKLKSSGQTGTIPSHEFDPNLYDQVQ